MYGWRARIGKVFPSRGDTFIYEFYKLVPEGVLLVPAIIGLFNLTKEELGQAIRKYRAAARELAQVGVDTLVLSGSPVFQLQGYGSDLEMIRAVEEETGIPAITSVTSEVEALRVLNMKKIVIATPFKEDVNDRSAAWYTQAGIEVLGIKGLGIEKNSEIAAVPPYASYQLAKQIFLATPGAQGIYIACPRWPTIENIERLEQDLGVPVVTSSQATIWKALRRSSVCEPLPNYGTLMREH